MWTYAHTTLETRLRLYLKIENGSLAGQEFEFEEGPILLGRGHDSVLRFHSEQDSVVSSRHAIIHKSEQGFFVVDEKSTNGTLLNGQFIDQAYLQDGDRLQLGREGPVLEIQVRTKPLTQEMPVSEGDEPTLITLKRTLSDISTYNPQKDKLTSPVGITLAIVITLGMMLIVMLLMLFSLGFAGAIIGTILAFAPAPFYLFLFLWMDRYDPEPPWAIAAAFGWGALFSIFVSYIVNTIFGSVAASFVGEAGGLTLSAIISAPFIEEITKGLGVFLIFVSLRKEFDGVLDGIVYAGVIGLGFATVENILYYGRTYLEAGGGALLAIVFLRGVLSPFIHSLFTSMTGIGCGLARESHSRTVQILMPLIGVAAAMALHSLWNISASLLAEMFFVAYFVVWVPLFALFLLFIFLMARREKKIIQRTLAFEVGGLLTENELRLAASLRERIRWLVASARNWKQLRARRRFLRAITKLAFCYWHVERATAANNQTISLPQIPYYRAEIASLKTSI